MSDSILYNQEVTTEILNDIAIDLGNTSFNGFGENKFGADELNNITAGLVSKGVLMSGHQCKPIISGENICIQTGTIVFDSGAKKKITEVVNIPIQNNTYVYALNKIAAGVCEIVVSSENPATDETIMNQDYVPIAKIGSEGEMTDMRRFSSAKVIIPVENQYISKSIEIACFTGSDLDVPIASFDIGFPCKIVYVKTAGEYHLGFLEDGVKSENLIINHSPDSVRVLRNGTQIEIYGSTYFGRNTVNFEFV